MGISRRTGCADCNPARHGIARHPRQTPPGDDLRSRLEHLEQTQWLSPEAMLTRQVTRLQRLLRHAYDTVPLYQQRFDTAGFDPRRPLTAVEWSRLPLLTRRDIQLSGPALRSTVLPCPPADVRTIVTSGSTGQPVSVASTPLMRTLWCLFTLRDHVWHRREFAGKLAVIRYTRSGKADPPEGETRESWGPATDAYCATGPGLMLNIDANIEEQVAWLLRNDPEYLLTYPSNVEALAEYCVENGVELPRLQQVRTIGEVVASSARQACLSAWNAPIVDVYTTQEVGYIALQCPEYEHYHVQSENVLVEIIDDDGAACGPGQVGRVVITALHNFATPLIRYEVGDYAEAGDACPCGRGLPVIRRVLGRTRNMLVLPDGRQRWPSIGQADDLTVLPPFYQYQIIQRTLDHVEVKLVAPRPLDPHEDQAARVYLRKMLGHPFDITFTYVDEIRRSPSGKFEEFRSEVTPPATRPLDDAPH